MFELIVFDWDGTLVDSGEKIVICAQRTCLELGLPKPSETAVKALIGLELREFATALSSSRDDALVDAIVSGYRTQWFDPSLRDSQLFPGVIDVLDTLGRQALLAVATGKSRAGLDRELASYNLTGRFQATRCADETMPKPNPDMLEEILSELGCQRSKTLMVGDTAFDMEMAHRAGVPRLGVTCGNHDQSTLEAWQPITCLPDVRSIPGWLDGLDS